jgi:hypothetical protein
MTGYSCTSVVVPDPNSLEMLDPDPGFNESGSTTLTCTCSLPLGHDNGDLVQWDLKTHKFQWCPCIRFRIRNPDPDPGRQK